MPAGAHDGTRGWMTNTSTVAKYDAVPNALQMPPLASEVVDASGVAAITAWILWLPPP